MSHSSEVETPRAGWWSRVVAAVRYVARMDPVRVQAGIRAVLVLAGAIGAGVGWAVPAGVEPWAVGVVVAFYALVEVFTTARTAQRTEPSAAVVEVERSGEVVAGEASELPTGMIVRRAGSLDAGSIFPQ